VITENPARVSTLLVCSGKGPASLEGVKVFCCQSTSTSQGREFVSRKHPVSNQEEAAWVQIGSCIQANKRNIRTGDATLLGID
jgi:hypothetical protein